MRPKYERSCTWPGTRQRFEIRCLRNVASKVRTAALTSGKSAVPRPSETFAQRPRTQRRLFDHRTYLSSHQLRGRLSGLISTQRPACDIEIADANDFPDTESDPNANYQFLRCPATVFRSSIYDSGCCHVSFAVDRLVPFCPASLIRRFYRLE